MEPRIKSAYRFGPFLLDPDAHLLLRDGRSVPLPPKAFDTLVLLVQSGGSLLTKDELLKLVWSGSYVEENNLPQYISMLRKALGDNGNGAKYIETVPRLGYRFVAEVQQRPDLAVVTQQTRLAWWKNRIVIAAGLAAIVIGAGLAWKAAMPEPGPIVVNSQRVGRIAGFWYYLFPGDNELYVLGRRSLMRLPINGGEPVAVAIPFELASVCDLSRVRPEFLTEASSAGTGDAPLWILPVPTGQAQRVGNIYAHSAAWSPDGESIVYAAGRDLYIANRDGTGSRRLWPEVGWAPFLRWSPDGRVIRYLANDDKSDSVSLWEISAQGGPPVRLLAGNANSNRDINDLAGEWTPDGKYFIYGLAQNGHSDLWASRETSRSFAFWDRWFGSSRRKAVQLTKGPVSMRIPVPSRDGKKVFAVATIEGAELVRYDAASRTFKPFLNGISADGLAFSRDGEWIAYTSFPDRTLWRSRADGSSRQQLTFQPDEALLPSWSPDGHTIAFMGKVAGKPRGIYLIAAEGGVPKPLPLTDAYAADPAWSPDGRSLAFGGAPWIKGWDPQSSAIRVVDLGSPQVQILPGSEGLWSPRWSPDGRWLVAESTDSKKLFVYNFSRRKWSKIAEASGKEIGYSSWAHDSRFVYFNLVSSTEDGIYRAGVHEHPSAQLDSPQPVLNLNKVRLKDTLGTWFTLTPDDQPLVLRDASAEEIYALTLNYQ